MSNFWDDDALPVAQAKEGFWDDDAVEMASDGSAIAAATSGLAQGASLGFADEIGAAGSAAMNAITGITGPLAGRGFDSIGADYERNRNQLRKEFSEVSEANPEISMAANLVGSIPTGGVFSGGKTLAARAGQSALGGGLSGLGTSQAESLSGMALDTGIGVGFGAGMQVGGEKLLMPAVRKGGELIGKAVSRAGSALDDGLKKVGRVAANVPEDVTERYLANSDAVNSALTREELAERVLDESGGVLAQLRSKLGLASSEAWDVLDNEPTLDTNRVKGEVNDLIEEILGGKKSNLNRQAGVGATADMVRSLETTMDQLNAAYKVGKISQGDLKTIVQDLQKKAYSDAGSPKTTHSAEALRMLSGKFNEVLKGENRMYAEKMLPVKDMTETLSGAESLFLNRTNPDASIDKVSRAFDSYNRPKNQFSKNAVTDIDRITGGTLGEDISNTFAKEAFEKGDTNGSRKTLFGIGVGKLVGGAAGGLAGFATGEELGAGAGAVAGFSADKYAGKAFKAFLDGRIKTPQAMQQISNSLGKYAAPLMEAASRGNNAVSATHFIMMQRDPGYREAVKALEDEK